MVQYWTIYAIDRIINNSKVTVGFWVGLRRLEDYTERSASFILFGVSRCCEALCVVTSHWTAFFAALTRVYCAPLSPLCFFGSATGVKSNWYGEIGIDSIFVRILGRVSLSPLADLGSNFFGSVSFIIRSSDMSPCSRYASTSSLTVCFSSSVQSMNHLDST